MLNAQRSVFTLPKAHLHAHLILSARPDTMLELAQRYGVDVTDAWACESLPELVRKSPIAFGLIRTPDDLIRLCREFVEDEAAQGVIYTQPMMGVGYFSRQFRLRPEEVFAIHEEGMRAGSLATGVRYGYMFGMLRHESAEIAEATAHVAAAHADRGVAALGIAGDELIGSFETFRRACETAREAGLLIVPHAGETGGPESVRHALQALRPDRIAHGVRSVESPDLLRQLADDGIPCDVCPTSNLKLGVVSDIATHPLLAMLEAGVPLTINSDDQLYFGSNVAEEYEVVRSVCGLSDNQLAEIARTSARVSGAPLETVNRMLAGIDSWLAAPVDG